jgi:NADH:ubiquinone oxidoreductase subunit 3 (subunit A)
VTVDPLLSPSQGSGLTSPPLAFLLYLLLALLLSLIGRQLASRGRRWTEKATPYASGEMPQRRQGLPGYGPFFLSAIFFAILHLGALVVATGGTSPASLLYLIGLLVALAILLLG